MQGHLPSRPAVGFGRSRTLEIRGPGCVPKPKTNPVPTAQDAKATLQVRRPGACGSSAARLLRALAESKGSERCSPTDTGGLYMSWGDWSGMGWSQTDDSGSGSRLMCG